MLLRDSWLVWTAALCLVAACGSDEGGDGTTTLTTTDGTGSSTSSTDTDTDTETGDGSSTTQSDETVGDGDSGDGDGDTGDGDGDSGDGDGDGDSGDGDGDSGDGDGDGDSGDGDGDTGDGDGDGGDGDGDGDSTTGDGDGDGDADCSDCAANTDLIYVLSDDAELWSFDPATNMFALVGALNCGTSTPFGTFSMSVSRAGIAWVMFQDNQLYQIDVNNPGSCVNSGWTPSQGFALFGMGFVSNSLNDPCEKLYMHDWSGSGGFSEGTNVGTMGAMEPSDLSVELLGSINYDGGELTGTGDGRLFAFAGSNPAKLIEYDKDSTPISVVATTPLTGLNLTNAFAFAHYEGDFFFFTESNSNPFNASKVTYYDPSNPGVYTDVVPEAPIRIVGAGVSTCAPLPE